MNGEKETAPEIVAVRYSASYDGARELSRYRDGQSIKLSNDEYFFIGDNVERSRDSRADGPTKTTELVGVVDLRYWPIGRFAIVR